MKSVPVHVRVNGLAHVRNVPPRMLLADFLRHEIGLTGTHIGCEHGVCGACTVEIDGSTARSCLTFAVQVDGADVRTVEGIAGDGPLSILQEEFRRAHALQCGFCTPGFLLVIGELLRRIPDPKEEDVLEAISGNLCRCTGYLNIVRAVLQTVQRSRA